MELGLTEQNCISVTVPRPYSINSRHIISNGRVRGWREEETGKERERKKERHRHCKTTVSLLINWKRTSTPHSPVQTYGVIRTTLLHKPPPCISSPCTPARKPFNQPRGEYMDMIWKKRMGRKREEKETGWEESISETDTIAIGTEPTARRFPSCTEKDRGAQQAWK